VIRGVRWRKGVGGQDKEKGNERRKAGIRRTIRAGGER
jgi:hypothetical protein